MAAKRVNQKIAPKPIPPEWLVKDENGKFKDPPSEATEQEKQTYCIVVAMHKTFGTG
jgi:hypothetical protein